MQVLLLYWREYKTRRASVSANGREEGKMRRQVKHITVLAPVSRCCEESQCCSGNAGLLWMGYTDIRYLRVTHAWEVG